MAPPSTGWLLTTPTTRAPRLPSFKSQASYALETAVFWFPLSYVIVSH